MSWYTQRFPHDLCRRPEWRYCFGLTTCGWARMLGSQFCIPCPCDKNPLCMMRHYTCVFVLHMRIRSNWYTWITLRLFFTCKIWHVFNVQSCMHTIIQGPFSLIDKINHLYFHMHSPVICNVEPLHPGLWWQSFSGRLDETLSGGMALTCQQAWWHHQQGLEFK